MWKWEKSVKGIFQGIDYPKLKFKECLLKHTGDWYFKPQYEFICTDSIDMNCINLIRFENLQQDFDIACDKIGIPKQLPHKNKTPTNITPNTTMTKLVKSLRKNTQKTLSILGTNLDNKT